MTGIPINDDDLHAFVDNQLEPARRALVMAWLRDNPADGEKVSAFLATRDALRAAFAEQDGLSVPARLNPHVIHQELRSRRVKWAAAAAVVLAFGVGGGGGWMLHDRLTPRPSAVIALLQEAVANHIVYTADRRRPTELGPDQRDDLARWVSNRLNRPVAPPDLSGAGYRYIGGRLAATAGGPAGMFMYQNDHNIRLTIFVRPIGSAENAPVEHLVTSGLDGFGWVAGGIGYTVVAAVPGDELQRVADQVRDLMKPKV